MKINYRQGFGILEVVIASMILVTVVGAVVAMGSASVRGGITASDKTTAYNLVQECLEKARQVRDTAWVDTDPSTVWDSKIKETELSVLSECDDLTVGKPEVAYTRNVTVGPVAWYAPGETPPTYGISAANKVPDNVVKVTATVKWIGENGEKQISGSTYLSDWKGIN